MEGRAMLASLVWRRRDRLARRHVSVAASILATRVAASCLAAAVSIAVGAAPATAQQMTLPGHFEVGGSGAAAYGIPIAVPPGTAGMAPALALNYSSQGGNGVAGMGWSLSGLLSVGRCPQTFVQDGLRGAITYTSSDRFC